MKKPNYNRFSYYCTGKNVETVYDNGQYRIEYNKSIDMFRINSDSLRLRNRKWFLNHMGYNPHYTVLLEAIQRIES